jgi:hypothetical protein
VIKLYKGSHGSPDSHPVVFGSLLVSLQLHPGTSEIASEDEDRVTGRRVALLSVDRSPRRIYFCILLISKLRSSWVSRFQARDASVSVRNIARMVRSRRRSGVKPLGLGARSSSWGFGMFGGGASSGEHPAGLVAVLGTFSSPTGLHGGFQLGFGLPFMAVISFL